MNIPKMMYEQLGLNHDERVMVSSEVLSEGFKVDVSAPERISDLEIAEVLLNNLSSRACMGLNHKVASTRVIVKNDFGDFYIWFNRLPYE